MTENPFDLARAAITTAANAVAEAFGDGIWTEACIDDADYLFRQLHELVTDVEATCNYTRDDADADKADGMYSAGEIGGLHSHHDIGGEG